MDRPGFLKILVDVAEQLAVTAGVEIAEVDVTAEPLPAHIRQRLAVW